MIGLSGSGKTPLLDAIAGLTRPDEGAITLTGPTGPVRVEGLAPHRRAHLGLGYAPQRPSVLTGLSVREHVALAVALCRRRRMKQPREIIDQALATMGLDHIPGRRASDLSGGERRRTELARALAQRPHVLVLDEPFAGVDAASVRGIRASLAALVADGSAVLMTDQRIELLRGLATRVAILHDGVITVEGELDPVLGSEQAAAALRGAAWR